MTGREDLTHIRTLIKARKREGSVGATKAKVESGQEVAAAEERYIVQLHDQIRLTLTEDGWVPVIAGKDGSLVGWAPASASTFKTPEEVWLT